MTQQPAVLLEHDVDWNKPEASNTAFIALNSAFLVDPMMQLFDADALRRLAGYIAHGLAVEAQRNNGVLGMYRADTYVCYTLLPGSIYGCFGNALANKVGWLVQQHLYPVAYGREY